MIRFKISSLIERYMSSVPLRFIWLTNVQVWPK